MVSFVVCSSLLKKGGRVLQEIKQLKSHITVLKIECKLKQSESKIQNKNYFLIFKIDEGDYS